MHQQSSHVDIAAFAAAQLPHPAIHACLLGSQASHAANSRTSLNAVGAPMAATTAVAVLRPTPGVSAKVLQDEVSHRCAANTRCGNSRGFRRELPVRVALTSLN